MARFSIAVSGTTASAATKNALTAYLQGKGWQVWHWFDELWLIAAADNVSAEELSREIRTIPGFHPQVHHIVMKLDGDADYFGWAPREAWDWMSKNWKRSDV
jgi:hypothetical protein